MRREPIEITAEEFDILRRLSSMLGHVPGWDLNDHRERVRAAGVLGKFLHGEGDSRAAFIVKPSTPAIPDAERIRLLEATVRFLWDAWSEAEGSGQPEAYTFDEENEDTLYRRPSAEVQKAVRDVLDRIPRFEVFKR